jgi:hypothetical protein
MQNAVPTRTLSTRTLLTALRAFCPEVEETTKASPHVRASRAFNLITQISGSFQGNVHQVELCICTDTLEGFDELYNMMVRVINRRSEFNYDLK